MAEDVKGPRPYQSPKRLAQAAATRAEIAAAALRSFVTQGYSATTLADIAEAAGVAVPTIKLAYGTKRTVLQAAWDYALKAGPDPRPIAEQEWFKEMMAAPDPREQLRLQATGSSRGKSRIAPIIEVIRAAAAGDEEIAALWAAMQAEYHDIQRRIVQALQRKGKLRKDLTETEATDLLYTLNHPTLYHMLVIQLRWPDDRYEQWLARTLVDQLLEPEA